MQQDQRETRQIEPARLDLGGLKTQMALGGALIVATVLWLGRSSLGADFLLDDYLHLDYCNRALHGDPSTLIQSLTGNWGGSDLMKSYRPIVTLSIFIDFLIFHLNSWGYHLTNLILYALCAILISLTTLEATGRMGNRAGALPAIWAGLLFCVYPLHAESVSWIIGRVDIIATLFYIGSLFLFLRYRLTGVKRLSVWSLIAFVLALASKEIAISLPVAIFAYAMHIKSGPIGARLKSAIISTLPYLAVLVAFAIVRTLILGTAIGGYDNKPMGLSTLKSLAVFADRESLMHILAPVSQEYLPIKQMLPLGATLFAMPFVIFAASLLLMVDKNKALIARYAFLVASNLGLAILALVPAFQIWHIYPNLVGSRLFFLSSAFIAMAQAHMIWSLWHISASTRANRIWLYLTAIVPVAIFAVHSIWYQIDAKPFATAGAMMRATRLELAEMLEESSRQKQPILITNLPQDYKGAGLIGRTLYLRDFLTYQLGKPLPADLVILEEKPNGLPEKMSQAAHDLLLRDSQKYLIFAPKNLGEMSHPESSGLFRKLCNDQMGCGDLSIQRLDSNQARQNSISLPARLKNRLDTRVEIDLPDPGIDSVKKAPALLLDMMGPDGRIIQTLRVEAESLEKGKIIYLPGYLRAYVLSEARTCVLRLEKCAGTDYLRGTMHFERR